MNKTEYLLTCINEESGEVIQEACKALRFGLGDFNPQEPGKGDNKRRLERELAQLMMVVDLLGLTIRDEDKHEKLEKLNKYMGYSRKCGTLVDKPSE